MNASGDLLSSLPLSVCRAHDERHKGSKAIANWILNHKSAKKEAHIQSLLDEIALHTAGGDYEA